MSDIIKPCPLGGAFYFVMFINNELGGIMSDIKTNNLWLMQGDCLERMKEIPDGSVDMRSKREP